VGTISWIEMPKMHPMTMQTYHVPPEEIDRLFKRWGKYIHTYKPTQKASEKRNFKTTDENKRIGLIGQLGVEQLNISLGIPIDERKQLCLIDTDENDGKLLINGGIPLQTKTKKCCTIFSPDWSLMIPCDQYKKYDDNTIIFGCVFFPDLNILDVVGYISYEEFDKKKRKVNPGDKQRNGFPVSGPPSYAVYYSELHNSQIEYRNFLKNGGSQ